KYFIVRVVPLVSCLALFAMPFLIARAAGGRIEGKVIDPKGAIVIGAAISVSGYTIEYYGNEEAVPAMRNAEEVGSMNTLGMSGPILADAQNSTRIYNAYFGKLPFNRLALTQQPAGNFVQAWQTLVYMPYTAFMDSTQRYMATGGNVRFATNNFFRYVAPYELAHQWWGHMVGWKSYHDQWMR